MEGLLGICKLMTCLPQFVIFRNLTVCRLSSQCYQSLCTFDIPRHAFIRVFFISTGPNEAPPCSTFHTK